MVIRRPPRWYQVVAASFVMLWVSVSLFYRLGASGIDSVAGTTSFEREGDFSLLRIDDARAFRVDRRGASVVKYKRAMFPFCPVCGVNEPAGTVMNLARYRNGDWVYTSQPQPFVEAVNLATSAVIDLPAGGDALTRPPQEFVAQGLDFSSTNALDATQLGATFPSLRPVNESCIVFNLAFIIVFAMLVVVGVALVFHRGPPRVA